MILFATLLPFALLSLLATESTPAMGWLTVPLSILLSGVFVIMERTGSANEDPFENRITDIPMTALCTTVERDLLAMLGHSPLPDPKEPEEGYLF